MGAAMGDDVGGSAGSLNRIARAWIAALEAGAADEELARFYHPDLVQTEYPNRLNPAGVDRTLPELLAALKTARALMTRQLFEIVTLTETGDRVAVEIVWTGWPTEPVGLTRPGEPVKARIAMFLDYEDGLIVRQRNYDCFEPF